MSQENCLIRKTAGLQGKPMPCGGIFIKFVAVYTFTVTKILLFMLPSALNRAFFYAQARIWKFAADAVCGPHGE